MTRTALVRDCNKNLKIIRDKDFYKNQKEFAEDLRGNGYRVLKIWNANLTDSQCDEWELLNRK